MAFVGDFILTPFQLLLRFGAVFGKTAPKRSSGYIRLKSLFRSSTPEARCRGVQPSFFAPGSRRSGTPQQAGSGVELPNSKSFAPAVSELFWGKQFRNGRGRDARRSCAHYEVFGAGAIAGRNNKKLARDSRLVTWDEASLQPRQKLLAVLHQAI